MLLAEWVAGNGFFSAKNSSTGLEWRNLAAKTIKMLENVGFWSFVFFLKGFKHRFWHSQGGGEGCSEIEHPWIHFNIYSSMYTLLP